MIKYLANNYSWSEQRIVEISVDSETKNCVMIKGARKSKRSESGVYFNTWEEAKDYLVNKAAQKVDSITDGLKDATEELLQMKKLNQP